jgi:drug/metabolite transporter (DMT)-like permease
MTDPLFFLFVLVSILGYGIHISLIAHLGRALDGTLVAIYRNTTLLFCIVPLLFFVPFSEVLAVGKHLPLLACGSLLGFLAFIFTLHSMRHLPAGVCIAITRTCTLIISIVLGMAFLGERLSPPEILLLVGILGAAVALSLLRSRHAHLDPTTIWDGFLYAVLSGTVVSFSLFFFNTLSRELHPLVAGYFFEAGVLAWALVYLAFKIVRGQYRGPLVLPFRQTIDIAGASLFVVAGTAGLALAFAHGPFALATGLGSALVTTLVSWFFFKERLSKPQIGIIVIIVVLMTLLKIYS